MLIVGSRQMMQQIQTPPNINFISKNLIPITEVKSITKLVIFRSFVAKCCKIQIIYSPTKVDHLIINFPCVIQND